MGTSMRLNKIKIQKIRNYFKNQPVKKAYLFGSYSRNMAKKESDADIPRLKIHVQTLLNEFRQNDK